MFILTNLIYFVNLNQKILKNTLKLLNYKIIYGLFSIEVKK